MAGTEFMTMTHIDETLKDLNNLSIESLSKEVWMKISKTMNDKYNGRSITF